MINCQKASRLISASYEQPLSLLQRAQLSFHLAICKRCRSFANNSDQLEQLMQQFTQQREGE